MESKREYRNMGDKLVETSRIVVSPTDISEVEDVVKWATEQPLELEKLRLVSVKVVSKDNFIHKASAFYVGANYQPPANNNQNESLSDF